MEYNNLELTRNYVNNIVNKEINYNNLSKYKSINKLNKVNINKVYKYFNSNKDKLDDNEIGILQLLESRLLNTNVIKDYTLKDSIIGLDLKKKNIYKNELNGADESLDS